MRGFISQPLNTSVAAPCAKNPKSYSEENAPPGYETGLTQVALFASRQTPRAPRLRPGREANAAEASHLLRVADSVTSPACPVTLRAQQQPAPAPRKASAGPRSAGSGRAGADGERGQRRRACRPQSPGGNFVHLAENSRQPTKHPCSCRPGPQSVFSTRSKQLKSKPTFRLPSA